MTVRDLLELVSEKKMVKIKPNGRRVYFVGSATEVPEGLMGCEVTELAPGMDDEDNLILGIWVTADKDWDLLVDCYGKADDVVSAVYDGAYYQLIGGGGARGGGAQKILQKKREERQDRYWTNSGEKKPEKIEWVQEAVSVADIEGSVAEISDMIKGLDLSPVADELLEE